MRYVHVIYILDKRAYERVTSRVVPIEFKLNVDVTVTLVRLSLSNVNVKPSVLICFCKPYYKLEGMESTFIVVNHVEK